MQHIKLVDSISAPNYIYQFAKQLLDKKSAAASVHNELIKPQHKYIFFLCLIPIKNVFGERMPTKKWYLPVPVGSLIN